VSNHPLLVKRPDSPLIYARILVDGPRQVETTPELEKWIGRKMNKILTYPDVMTDYTKPVIVSVGKPRFPPKIATQVARVHDLPNVNIASWASCNGQNLVVSHYWNIWNVHRVTDILLMYSRADWRVHHALRFFGNCIRKGERPNTFKGMHVWDLDHNKAMKIAVIDNHIYDYNHKEIIKPTYPQRPNRRRKRNRTENESLFN